MKKLLNYINLLKLLFYFKFHFPLTTDNQDFVVVVKNNAFIKSKNSLHFSSCLKKKLTELL